MMQRDDDPVFTHPESYGIENPESPGEPDRTKQPPSEPVPGTGHAARIEHMREHDAAGEGPDPESFRDRKERLERDEARRDIGEAEEDLTS